MRQPPFSIARRPFADSRQVWLSACRFAFLFLSLLAPPGIAGSGPLLQAQEADEESLAEDPDAALDDSPAAAAPDQARRAPAATASPSARPPAASRAAAVDPVVSAVLASNPQSPGELLHAVEALSNLGRGELAGTFFDRLFAARLNSPQLADLSEEIDGAALLRLSHDRSLGDPGRAWIGKLAETAAARRADPSQLADWAKSLGSEDGLVQQRAARSLALARRRAVGPLVDLLAANRNERASQLARQLLRQLGDDAVEPLIALSRHARPAAQSTAVELLGMIGARRAAPALLARSVAPDIPLQPAAQRALTAIVGVAPTVQEARILLDRRVRELLDETMSTEARRFDRETWRWDAKARTVVPQPLRADDEAADEAAFLSGELWALAGESSSARLLFGVATLEAAQRQIGLDQPLPMEPNDPAAAVARLGAPAVADILAAAIAGGNYAAAAGACGLLGASGEEDLLRPPGGQPAALVRAASCPDQRVQAAALRAILDLKPRSPFAGSSIVPESLSRLAGAAGRRQALIVHPRLDLAQHLAGELATLGIDGLPATNGRQARTLAAQSPDIEVIFVHMAVVRPDAEELLAQFRSDRRTANLPLALIAIEGDERHAECLVERIARENPVPVAPWSLSNEAERGGRDSVARMLRRSGRRPPLPLVMPPAADAQSLRNQIEALEQLADRGRTTPERRQADARWALASIAGFSAAQQTLFDLRSYSSQLELALWRREHAAAAPSILARLASPQAQLALADLASLPQQPLAVRTAAATAFADSVDRFGMLLARRDVVRRYELYNASADEDAAVQQVLASILDVLERHGRERYLLENQLLENHRRAN